MRSKKKILLGKKSDQKTPHDAKLPVSNRLFWSLEEKQALWEICNTAWDFEFPGYNWVALRLNSQFKNNRTSAACRSMDRKMPIFPNGR